jgi:hypothetical protein
VQLDFVVLDDQRNARGRNSSRSRKRKLRAPARFRREHLVADIVFTLVTVAFFAAAIFYLRGCERLR